MAHSAAEHVGDTDKFHLSDALFDGYGLDIRLPGFDLFGHHFQVTKFMVLELIAAILAVVIFVPLCRKAAKGTLPKGPFWNAFESLLTFIRNDVARPNLGEHDADQYVPF